MNETTTTIHKLLSRHRTSSRDVLDLLNEATDAVASRQPRRAFDMLWQAELAHHHPLNQPPPAGEEKKLMSTWLLLRSILPEQV